MTQYRDTLIDKLGRFLAARLVSPSRKHRPYTHANVAALRRALEPGDVLLVEGHARVSVAIKYLTQSTWSHSAIYVGNAVGRVSASGETLSLVEVNLGEGCVAVPLSKYEHHNTRICRAASLSVQDRAAIVHFMIESIGRRYDIQNIWDLLRYFFPTPPVPVRWRRRMLSIGSGDPTRAICSSLIAEAFQQVHYPILPRITKEFRADRLARSQRREILQIRHHSLYAPRDFDLSPYFEVVKPTLTEAFDHRNLLWKTQRELDITGPEDQKSVGSA
ncbi:MAG: YiiX/YebB-like N1pC/P60 family cysteine hydrolase [Pseudomonadota bacterium]